MKGDTRNRILVASLLLFNEHGEPGTPTNLIADEVDISPGNLHYHFPRKELIVGALLDEFQADAARVLAPPEATISIDDFWVFLHDLLELAAAYRFLFRDLEALTAGYPRADRVLGQFARTLARLFEIYLRFLTDAGWFSIGDIDAPVVARNLAVIALFSERFDRLSGVSATADDNALRIAGSILNVLKPFSASDTGQYVGDLAAHYDT
ncbi:MAG: TetR/AcrR family transcriptional regulator [Woeseiaceae bacterium]|nr:TetR/AcrR family transcriptional regulator [Woeseiaceae bacterium]